MSKIILFAFIAMLFFSLGCGPKNHTLQPEGQNVITAKPFLTTIQTSSGPVVVWAQSDKTAPSGVRVLYLCDYPNGFYGPPAPGHCYEDGSGCTGPSLDEQNQITTSSLGDPDPTEADTDGGLNRTRTIGDPTDADYGDPTADDRHFVPRKRN